jgi:3-phosphoshikimate 1-carboxyvinyltransferase
MVPPGSARVTPVRGVRGRVRVPGDKSVAHRYALLASLADGRSVARGFAPGADCQSTLGCLEALGIQLSRSGDTITVIGRGPGGFRSPQTLLNSGNSGPTARLLAGILAGRPMDTVLTDDASHWRRPMRRMTERQQTRNHSEIAMRWFGAGAVGISYPGFFEVLGSLAA